MELSLPRPPALPRNTSCTKIFLQIREKGLLRQLNPLKATHKDRSKYCRFHWDYVHDTEDCHDLQNQINELIRRGHLRRYLKELGEATPSPRGPFERQIDVITGGPTTGGSNSIARKAYAHSIVEKRPRPKFEPSHHDNALVISIRIANAWVKTIMVDTGSSANVLYLNTFKKLSLSNEDLTPMNLALAGFTRDSISPLETTVLLVTIGEEPKAKMTMTTFTVVDLPSAYNVILDHLALNKLKAVVSTYHQAIKFSTLVGVKESRRDPVESTLQLLLSRRGHAPIKSQIPVKEPRPQCTSSPLTNSPRCP
ncbi:uncharacterized protein LOC103980864 [Musa acuminata AAA Group]|uniref:uncharacterized protein LOC103980864 n=1 Tax=Musa acuminata AAA Group TaxID=214697 RepID=UPI0031D9F1C7